MELTLNWRGGGGGWLLTALHSRWGLTGRLSTSAKKAISNYKLYCVMKPMLCTRGACWLHTLSSPRVNEIIFLLGAMPLLNPWEKAAFAQAAPPIEQAPETKHYLIVSYSQDRLLLSDSNGSLVGCVIWAWAAPDRCVDSQGCLHTFNTSLVGGLPPFCFLLPQPSPFFLKVPSLLLLF